MFDFLSLDIVTECFHGSWPRTPESLKITQDTAIDRDNPIVREMFVADFTHLRLLLVKNLGAKRQQRENDRRLCTQRNTSKLGCVAINAKHIVDVIILQRINQIFNKITVNLKPSKVRGGVLLRDDFNPCIFIV